jgi:hypothetical protein
MTLSPTRPQPPVINPLPPANPFDRSSIDQPKTTVREKNINKPTPFTGNRKKVENFIQECKMYLHINRQIYIDDEDKIGFVLSFMNENEALTWKQTFMRYVINEQKMKFPSFEDFVIEILSYFQPANVLQDAAHKLSMLRQGNKTAEEIITEFRLLVSQAGYSTSTASDHLHIIEKLRNVLNPSLVKKVMLLDNPPTDLNGWVHKAIALDSQYRNTMEVLGGLNGRRTNDKGKVKETKKTTYMDYFNRKKYREEKDPNAMDIDAMSTEKRMTLMKKGACFICEEPGHMAREHDEHMRKKKEYSRGSTSSPPKKKNIGQIHAMLQGLTPEETKELLALQTKEGEKKDDDEDF